MGKNFRLTWKAEKNWKSLDPLTILTKGYVNDFFSVFSVSVFSTTLVSLGSKQHKLISKIDLLEQINVFSL